MEKWQDRVLFVVGVGGVIVLLLGDSIGVDVKNNPLAYTGVGAILTYVLSKKRDEKKDEKKEEVNG